MHGIVSAVEPVINNSVCVRGFIPLLVGVASGNTNQDALTVAAMLTVQNPFVHRRGAGRERKERLQEAMEEFAVTEGDHVTYLNVFNCFEDAGADSKWCEENSLNYRALVRAGEIRQQLSRCVLDLDSVVPSKVWCGIGDRRCAATRGDGVQAAPCFLLQSSKDPTSRRHVLMLTRTNSFIHECGK